MRENKIIPIEDFKDSKEEHEEFNEYESWEGDYYYYDREDWEGLVK